jgi:serine/threonine protein phosphatase 1
MAQHRIIAVGDVHGCSAALAAVLEAIRPTSIDTLVLLGDYIDRGPDSRGVIELILELRSRCRTVALLGNHEEMLLGALEDRKNLKLFMRFGGRETLNSYGIDDIEQIPAEHLAFVKNCCDYHETADHLFVHAYFDPDAPMTEQESHMLRWASPPVCTGKPHCSGKTAIVGHTAQVHGEILDQGFLKCIDTFCHGGGWLTAIDVNTGHTWQASKTGQLRAKCP